MIPMAVAGGSRVHHIAAGSSQLDNIQNPNLPSLRDMDIQIQVLKDQLEKSNSENKFLKDSIALKQNSQNNQGDKTRIVDLQSQLDAVQKELEENKMRAKLEEERYVVL
jgi:hypothetical protein